MGFQSPLPTMIGISTVLSTGDKWTRARLRVVLLALLVHNKEQAQRFERRFDSFFPEQDSDEFSDEEVKRFLLHLHEIVRKNNEDDTPKPTEEIVPPVENRTDGPIPVRRKPMVRRPLFRCVMMSVLLVGGLILYLRPNKPPEGDVAVTDPTASPAPPQQGLASDSPSPLANIKASPHAISKTLSLPPTPKVLGESAGSEPHGDIENLRRAEQEIEKTLREIRGYRN